MSGPFTHKYKSQTLMRRPATDHVVAGKAPSIVNDVLNSSGNPLERSTLTFMEPRFGHDFSQVRIHADAKAASSARAVNALAFTVGHDIVFGKEQYAPHTVNGQKLLAHELTHVVQQMNAQPSGELSLDNSHEQAAEAASTFIGDGTPLTVLDTSSTQGLARQTRDYAEIKKEVLAELNRNMPVAILGLLDELDQKTREALNADPEISGAITALPPKARDIVLKHLLAGLNVGKTKGSDPQPVTRARFEKIMNDHYGVKIIRDGTFQDQAFGNMKESDWKPWQEKSSSPVYGLIIEAFVNLEKTFGGLPPVKEILFFDAEYHRDDQGDPIKDTSTGASYHRGILTIYSAVQTGNKMFNMQDALESPTMEQAVKRNITHELGHGIAETALNQGTNEPPGADPDLFKEYLPAAGWKDGKLYDIQEPAVQTAFAKSITPPPQFEIMPSNVATKPWKERPLTAYMADNPGDDFAETIMAYVNEPERLKKFSPARYAFIEKHKSLWLASAHPKKNIWEETKQGGPTRVLKPSRPSDIWERTKETNP